MYFDFEDYRPDFTPVGRAISWREGVLLSIIVHLVMFIGLLLAPKFLPDSWLHPPPASVFTIPERKPSEETRFVFVQPRLDTPAPRPPDRGEASDKDRIARAPERAPKPQNPLPFSRGNTFERIDQPPQAASRAEAPAPGPPAVEQPPQPQPEQPKQPAVPDTSALPRAPETQTAMRLPPPAPPAPAGPSNASATSSGRSAIPGGILGEALRTLQQSVRSEQFENQQGGGGQFGPNIQFDTKGVEFGPWIRRFIAQVRRNWFIPYAAMTAKGHVVVTFNVHKSGSITDLAVVGPSPIEPFNNAAYGALSGSNPTQPLPPEYPSEKAFFTVTFFYNESPP